MEPSLNDEYSESELENIVESALGQEGDSGRVTLTAPDAIVLRELEELLKDYCHPADRSYIYKNLLGQIANRKQTTEAESLKVLHTRVKNCSVCPNVVSSPELPTWNVQSPDAVVVTDLPLKYSNGGNLVVEALKSSGFSSSNVAATSLVRCLPKGKKPSDITIDQIDECTKRYLFSELDLMRPRLILACGSGIGSFLANRKIKITQEAGKVFWLGSRQIMLLTSPGYASNTESGINDFKLYFKQAYSHVYGN